MADNRRSLNQEQINDFLIQLEGDASFDNESMCSGESRRDPNESIEMYHDSESEIEDPVSEDEIPPTPPRRETRRFLATPRQI